MRPGRGGGRDRIRKAGRYFAWGSGGGFYLYEGYYYGDCNWLLRRARATGVAYWWSRYRQCRAW